MIEDYFPLGGFQNWNDVPISTQEEVEAYHATLNFSADTSLSEKVQRIFNDAMFFIVGAKILSALPVVKAAASSMLGSWSFAAIGGSTLTQIPAIAAIIALAPKIIMTLALIVVIRKIAAVIVNHFIYIAAFESYYNKQAFNKERWEQFEKLNDRQFECRRIALNKSGIDYDAFVIEHKDTKGNGQWVVIAGGNGWVGERAIDYCSGFKDLGFNILYVNGPGVGCSTGFPTSYSIGAGQEAGLQFVEKIVGAKKVLFYGTSLGGGAQAEAILMHEEFKENIDYIVWSDRSFDTVSNAASSMVTRLAKPFFFILGIELNGVAGAKKLEKLGIKHIVTQNNIDIRQANGVLPFDGEIYEEGTDGVIPNEASLYVGLRKAGLQDPQRLKFYGNERVRHNGALAAGIQKLVNEDIQAFLAQA